MKILVVEDEQNIAKMIRSVMEAEGYECLMALDGLTALELFKEHKPDLVILDWNMPGMSGIDVCTRIRQSSVADPYILMLTARRGKDDRIDGFSSGADDYMTKSYSPKELTVRVRALLRRDLRNQKEEETKLIESAHLRLDPEHLAIWTRPTSGSPFKPLGEKVTAIEFNILATLAQRPGRIWTRGELLDQVWNPDYDGSDRIVDTYIKKLRAKVKVKADQPLDQFIKTQVGTGYFFEDSSDV